MKTRSDVHFNMSPNLKSTPAKGTRNEKDNITRSSTSALVSRNDDPENFSIQNYSVGSEDISTTLYRAEFQQASAARSFLRTGFSASDTATNPPDSLATLREMLIRHFNPTQHADSNSPDIVPKSKFVSLWTTRKAAEGEIKERRIASPKMAGLEGSWTVYAISGERLKKHKALVFSAVELHKVLRETVRSIDTGTTLSEADGLFLVWSQVPRETLVRRDSVSEERMWELGLSIEELKVVSEGIRVGFLKVVQEDDSVTGLQDLAARVADTDTNSQKGNVASYAIHGKQLGARLSPELGKDKYEDLPAGRVGSVTTSEQGEGKQETRSTMDKDKENRIFQVGADDSQWIVEEILTHKPLAGNRKQAQEYLVGWAGDWDLDDKYEWVRKQNIEGSAIAKCWSRVRKIEKATLIGDRNFFFGKQILG